MYSVLPSVNYLFWNVHYVVFCSLVWKWLVYDVEVADLLWFLETAYLETANMYIVLHRSWLDLDFYPKFW